MSVLTTLAAATVVAVSAGNGTSRADADDEGPGQHVLVVGGAQTADSDCHLARVGRAVVGFTEALRRGDIERLARYWRPRFRSFGIGDRATGNFVVNGMTPDEAIASVRAAGEVKLRLSTVSVGRGGALIYRGAWLEGGEPRHFSGKAEMECDTRNIWVWQAAIFRRAPFRSSAPICPEPNEPRHGRLVVCRR